MDEIGREAVADLLEVLGPAFSRCLDDAANSGGDFGVVEKSVRATIAVVRRALVSAGLEQAVAAVRSAWKCPSCGDALQRHGMRWRTVVTAEGEGRYRSIRYRCNRCHRDRYPLETANGLRGCQYTTTARGVIATAGARMPYEEAAAAVCDRGIAVSAKQVDRICSEVASWRKAEEGRAIATSERLRQQQTDERVRGIHGWRGWDAGTPALLSLDGGKVRSPIPGADGLEWYEARIGVIASALDRPRSPSIYCAGVKDPDAIFQRLYAAWRSDPRLGRPLLFCADGADWIWRRVPLYFPQAVQLLDIYHAGEHVASAAAACWGDNSPRHRKWRRNARRMLLTPTGPERIRRILHSQLKAGRPCDPVALARELAYLRDHKSRMGYRALHKRGWAVGSGAMESAVKQVSTQRLRLPGMMWSRHGADNMLALRSALLSHDLQHTIQRTHAEGINHLQHFLHPPAPLLH